MWLRWSFPLQIHPSLTLSRLYHSKTQQAQRNINEEGLRGKRSRQKLRENVSHTRHGLIVLMPREKFTMGTILAWTSRNHVCDKCGGRRTRPFLILVASFRHEPRPSARRVRRLKQRFQRCPQNDGLVPWLIKIQHYANGFALLLIQANCC